MSTVLSRSCCEVFTPYPLGASLAHLMFADIEMASVSPPAIRVAPADIERRKQRLQVLKDSVLAFATHISQHGVGGMVNGVPLGAGPISLVTAFWHEGFGRAIRVLATIALYTVRTHS